MSWPPTNEYLQSSPVPHYLYRFLLKLIVQQLIQLMEKLSKSTVGIRKTQQKSLPIYRGPNANHFTFRKKVELVVRAPSGVSSFKSKLSQQKCVTIFFTFSNSGGKTLSDIVIFFRNAFF